MIEAKDIEVTRKYMIIGEQSKGQNPGDIYTCITLRSLVADPKIKLAIGDILLDSYQFPAADLGRVQKIIADHVSMHVQRLNNRNAIADDSELRILDVAEYSTPPPVALTEEEIAKRQAEQEAMQKYQLLEAAKRKLDVGYLTQQEFDAIKADALAAKEATAAAVAVP
jgi:hypothetical protein